MEITALGWGGVCGAVIALTQSLNVLRKRQKVQILVVGGVLDHRSALPSRNRCFTQLRQARKFLAIIAYGFAKLADLPWRHHSQMSTNRIVADVFRNARRILKPTMLARVDGNTGLQANCFIATAVFKRFGFEANRSPCATALCAFMFLVTYGGQIVVCFSHVLSTVNRIMKTYAEHLPCPKSNFDVNPRAVLVRVKVQDVRQLAWRIVQNDLL